MMKTQFILTLRSTDLDKLAKVWKTAQELGDGCIDSSLDTDNTTNGLRKKRNNKHIIKYPADTRVIKGTKSPGRGALQKKVYMLVDGVLKSNPNGVQRQDLAKIVEQKTNQDISRLQASGVISALLRTGAFAVKYKR